MEIRSQLKKDLYKTSADILVIGVFQEEELPKLDTYIQGSLQEKCEHADFSGKPGQTAIFATSDNAGFQYALLVGLGKQGEVTLNAIRTATGLAVSHAQRLQAKSLAITLTNNESTLPEGDVAKAVTEASLLARYEFAVYKKEQKRIRLEELFIYADEDVSKSIQQAKSLVEGVTLARDLVNTPAKDMKPARLAEVAKELAEKSNGLITATIHDRAWCEEKGMNAYLAVAQGADSEPKFIHLVYRPKQSKKRVAIVGKGVTFDSGGLSLKPGQYMETMKCDMAGSAAVLGLFEALPELAPDVEVHGLIAATENMPSGKAIRPGDVVKAMNGKSIEILNTDAEGRLTMADALGYAAEQDPDYMIDLATLTGACVVGLGEEIAAVMSNDDDLANMIKSAAVEAGEEIWHMPLYPGYKKLLKSQVADLRNIATSRYGGSLTAGLFLQEFVEEGRKWAHLDIAGPAFAERPIGSYLSKGGTGYGVRTLAQWLSQLT